MTTSGAVEDRGAVGHGPEDSRAQVRLARELALYVGGLVAGLAAEVGACGACVEADPSDENLTELAFLIADLEQIRELIQVVGDDEPECLAAARDEVSG